MYSTLHALNCLSYVLYYMYDVACMSDTVCHMQNFTLFHVLHNMCFPLRSLSSMTHDTTCYIVDILRDV